MPITWKRTGADAIPIEKEAAILTEEELREAVAKIFKRSQTDLEFRKLCLSNPSEAVLKVCGKPLPEGVKIKFLEPETGSPRTGSDKPSDDDE